MAAPEYVPPALVDQPRSSLPLPPSRGWTATRPGDLERGQPVGRNMGRPGPDQGYVLVLAERFHGKLRLAPGEDEHDVVAGCAAVALRRASSFGRAPIKPDLDLAFGLFGYLDEAPADLVGARTELFRGAGHDYWDRRTIVDSIPAATLRLSPAEVRSRLGEWRRLAGFEV